MPPHAHHPGDLHLGLGTRLAREGEWSRGVVAGKDVVARRAIYESMGFDNKNKSTGTGMTGFLRAALFGLICLLAGMPPAPPPIIRTAGALADRLCRRRPGRHRGADHEPVAVGPFRPAIRGGKSRRAPAAISQPPPPSTRRRTATPSCSTRPNNAISTSLYKHLSYDFIRDTVPVASIMQLTNMLVVSNAMPVRNVQEFIDYCKANPTRSPTRLPASAPRCICRRNCSRR